MNITVLIVEDDLAKLGRVRKAVEDAGVDPARVQYALNVVEALEKVRETRFDLMLLDINLPRRFNEPAQRGGGMEVLREISRNAGDDLHRPRYIVGVTAFADVVAQFGEQFADQLWTLVHYQDTSDRWISQLKAKIDYIAAIRKSDNFTDGRTYGVDLAIICALEDPELDAVRRLPLGWQPLKIPSDETRYLAGTLTTDHGSFSIIAAAAPRMGMPASAVLATKIIASFRPRFLAMSGICAGRVEKTGLGDIIVADPSWDWGSGKIDSVKDEPRFQPSPHQIPADLDLQENLKGFLNDPALLAQIKQKARGNKPDAELKVRFGPLASGAAVVANRAQLDELIDKNRGILGLEMEAYGVASACMGAGKPRPKCLIIKSVCDFADKDKVDDYQEYAAETSAIALWEVAKRIL